MKRSLLTAADKLLIVIACLALGGLTAALIGPPEQATHIVVLHGNQELHRLPLDVDQTIAVKGNIGESVIEISHGRARFIHAPCRQQVCIHHGWIDQVGKLAACLPNRVALRALAQP